MKHAPADGLFNEFRDIALLHTLSAERAFRGAPGVRAGCSSAEASELAYVA
jgi:hypothetical protein